MPKKSFLRRSAASLLIMMLAGLTENIRALEAVVVAAQPGKPATVQIEFFEKKVRPILEDNCYDCHSADTKTAGGLRVDDWASLLKGGDTGPAIVPGDPAKSLLLQRIQQANPKKRMPKNSDPLAEDEITILTTWIKNGAVWSDRIDPAAVVRSTKSKPSATAPAADILAQPAGDQLEFFEKKIRPIFVSHCYNCHSADTKPAGGLRVDDLDGLLSGGDNGAGVVPGKPENSLIIERVLSDDPKRRMPKEGDLLTETEVSDLKLWIRNGVAWPREQIPPSIGHVRADYAALKTNHWAWQPLTHPEVPPTPDNQWPHDDIDRFILSKLAAKQLAPVADADRITLIRRVTFDLTGLPPSSLEVDAFVNDTSTNANALAAVVDRLLSSPRYGEYWGRHWLDVARYAESTGPSRNVPYPFAWKYRDYVIKAVADDVPYNRFVQEQIAGDLLPAATPAERDRLNTATGFLALGVKDVNQRFKNRFIMDNVDEQIDVVTRSTMALTVSCARCHNHKFDPIPTTDYYALAGIFTSTEDCAGVRNKMGGAGLAYYDPANLVKLTDYVAVEPPKEKVAALQAELAEAKKAWDDIRGTPLGLSVTNGVRYQRRFRVKYDRLQAQVLALTDPASQGHAVHGVRDAKSVADTDVRIRGEAERHGPTVPRGFLTTFKVPAAPAIATNHSGRLELAEWLTSANNPLFARVMVNRIWGHLFGQGLVTTMDNFGVMGDRPSDPELLDYLASTFIRDGYSEKRLIRSIVLSHAYQLGSEAPAAYLNIDPDNHFVWRHSPRRLEAEEIRDSILITSGDLQLKPPGTAFANDLPMVEIRDNGNESKKINEAADQALCRSVYLPLLRGVTPSQLAAFDPVDQTLVSGQRESTTVPTQALFMLNSSFVSRESLALARRLLSEKDQSDIDRIQQAYHLVLDRAPDSQEIERSKEFIAQYASAYVAASVNLAVIDHPAVALAESQTETDGKTKTGEPVNPDELLTPDVPVAQDHVQPANPGEAAWMSFTKALYASAEFRFVR